MFERLDAMKTIQKGIVNEMEALGFTFNTLKEEGVNVYIEFTKDDTTIKLDSYDNVLDILVKQADGDFAKIATNLLELRDTDEKSLKSLGNEIVETVTDNYGKKATVRQPRGAQKTVSRADVRAGMSYDANTLASKIVLVYPELKEEYKANSDKYGPFLAEDFFVNHANEKILATIKNGDSATRKKLFKILQDMYQDGSSDTQDIICVTILGEMNNDIDMLAVCRIFIDDDEFYNTVVAVNELLVSRAGKKLKKKMENPPKYNPKMDKKGGFMANMLDASNMPQQ